MRYPHTNSDYNPGVYMAGNEYNLPFTGRVIIKYRYI